jgi:hypothetical protein
VLAAAPDSGRAVAQAVELDSVRAAAQAQLACEVDLLSSRAELLKQLV